MSNDDLLSGNLLFEIETPVGFRVCTTRQLLGTDHHRQTPHHAG